MPKRRCLSQTEEIMDKCFYRLPESGKIWRMLRSVFFKSHFQTGLYTLNYNLLRAILIGPNYLMNFLCILLRFLFIHMCIYIYMCTCVHIYIYIYIYNVYCFTDPFR